MGVVLGFLLAYKNESDSFYRDSQVSSEGTRENLLSKCSQMGRTVPQSCIGLELLKFLLLFYVISLPTSSN